MFQFILPKCAQQQTASVPSFCDNKLTDNISIQANCPSTTSGYLCQSINCHHRQGSAPTNIRFHSFPKDPELAHKWIINLRNASLDNISIMEFCKKRHVVCSVHFEDSMYVKPEMRHLSTTRLKKDAFPTVIHCSNPPPQLKPRRVIQRCDTQVEIELSRTNSVFTQTTSDFSEELAKSLKSIKSLKAQVTRLKKRNSFLRCKLFRVAKKSKCAANVNVGNNNQNGHFGAILNQFPKSLSCIVQSQLLNRHKKLRSVRWTDLEVNIAMSIYYYSPKCYNHLRGTLKFCLPSYSVLRRRFSSTDLEGGPSKTLLSAINKKLQNSTPLDRYGVLMLDGMHIKEFVQYSEKIDKITGLTDGIDCSNLMEIADQCLVVLVRGIFTNWKQVLGFRLIRGQVGQNLFIDTVMTYLVALDNAGIHIMALVCDQEPTQWAAVKTLMLPNTTHFIHPSNGNLVYVLADVPHLLKNTRNNLLTKNIIFGDLTAKWDVIRFVWRDEEKRDLKLLPKLSWLHIAPPPWAKMKVSLAAQALSKTMSAAIRTMVHYGTLPSDSLGTAEFVEKIDRLFDLLNTSSSHSVYKPSVNHNNFLQVIDELSAFEEWINSWKFFIVKKNKVKNSLPFREGWLLSIASIKCILIELFNQQNVESVFLRRFCQDPLENTFSLVRAKNGNNYMPTYQQFKSAIQIVSVNQILKPLSRGKNCENDDTNCFIPNSGALSDSDELSISTISTTTTAAPGINTITASDVPLNMCIQPECIEGEIISYISGYLVHANERRVCENCMLAFTSSYTSSVFIDLKTADNCHLVKPSAAFSWIIHFFEKYFLQLLSDSKCNKGPRLHMISVIENSAEYLYYCSSSSCLNSTQCISIILAKYMLLRLHHHCKLLNSSVVRKKRRF